MAISIEGDDKGNVRVTTIRDEHDHWDDGYDRCGTCGTYVGPQQEGAEYAVHREDGWHIATWDGGHFNVTSNWQSGDRWTPEQVDRAVLLPRDV